MPDVTLSNFQKSPSHSPTKNLTDIKIKDKDNREEEERAPSILDKHLFKI